VVAELDVECRTQAPVKIAMFDRDMRHTAMWRRWRTDYGPSETRLAGRGLSHLRTRRIMLAP
jgi:hypothetical protein